MIKELKEKLVSVSEYIQNIDTLNVKQLDELKIKFQAKLDDFKYVY